MSTFSLISSAHQRLLRHLPDKGSLEYSEEEIPLALNLFLQPPLKPGSLSVELEPRRISRRMLWVWQCPTMLMSYSWVFFLVGYALHVLTPVFGPSQAEVSSQVSSEKSSSSHDKKLTDIGCHCHCVRLRVGRPQFRLLCRDMPAPSPERDCSVTGVRFYYCNCRSQEVRIWISWDGAGLDGTARLERRGGPAKTLSIILALFSGPAGCRIANYVPG
jgi:hypothetical protein